jgi:hypothetical protein
MYNELQAWVLKIIAVLAGLVFAMVVYFTH